MELDGRLCSDSLLREFFNEYLRLEVWPVALQYDERTGTISECCLATDHRPRLCVGDPSVRCNLLDWAQRRRWDTFLRSRLFCEYRLCCSLNGGTPASPDKLRITNSRASSQRTSSLSSATKTGGNGRPARMRSSYQESAGGNARTESVMSSTLPEELWSEEEEEEEPVAIKTESEERVPDRVISCSDLLKLKSSLSGTMAAILIELWVEVEAWQVLGECEWVDLRKIRKSYYSLLKTEPKGVLKKVRRMEGEEWMKEAQEHCIQTLTNYWLPRFYSARNMTHSLPHIKKEEGLESHDASLPFVHGLRCNALAGSPFQSYLNRENLYGALHKVRVWEACDNMLSCQLNSHQVLRESWRVWSTITQKTTHGACEGIPGQSGLDVGEALSYASSQLFQALQNTDGESAKVTVEQVEVMILGDLKRLWTKFLRDDHDSYIRCLQLPSNSISELKEINEPRKRFTRKKVKKRRKKSVVSLELEGTPLEPLRDAETLAQFEQFLVSECGDASEETLSYQLWKAVTSCLAQRKKDKREAMALKIQKKFIFTDSDFHLDLCGSRLELVDPMQEMERPCTPALGGIQSSAAKMLAKAVERFLIESGELKDSVGSLSSLNYKPKESISNKTNGYCVRNEMVHFAQTLEHNSTGPMSHQLKSFSLYLEEQSPLSQRKTLLNNVQFWLEVKKFNSMYLSGTNMHVLLSKGEALIDRYLDTTTPPWIKVTVSSELAGHVISATADLAKVKVPNHIYRLNDLLGRCQKMVFLDIVPYWSGFLQQYTPPDGSSISLPPVTSCPHSRTNTGRGSVSVLHLPPLQKRDRTPLLSYSKHKGVQWKFAVNLD